jgi:hypothetical protein
MFVVTSGHAFTSGNGGAETQIDIVSAGGDITATSAIDNIFLPTVSGNATANYTTTTTGGDYFNTNSLTTAQGSGSGYQQSFYGISYIFTNNGAQTESVTLDWQGYVVSSTQSDSGTAYSWDESTAYLTDDNASSTPIFEADAFSESFSTTYADQFASGTYTLYLTPGETDQIDSLAENQGQSFSSAPSPAAGFPFLIGALTAIRRRFRK